MRYHGRIIDSILETDSTEDFICSLAELIKRLAVDHIHLVGDISFDRGGGRPRSWTAWAVPCAAPGRAVGQPTFWMGAAAGEPACVVTVLRNNLRYGSYEILENDYGISLRSAVAFADRTYKPGERSP